MVRSLIFPLRLTGFDPSVRKVTNVISQGHVCLYCIIKWTNGKLSDDTYGMLYKKMEIINFSLCILYNRPQTAVTCATGL